QPTRRQETKYAESVVDRHDHHVLLGCERVTRVVGALTTGVGTAVEEHEDGKLGSFRRRGLHVEEQAILGDTDGRVAVSGVHVLLTRVAWRGRLHGCRPLRRRLRSRPATIASRRSRVRNTKEGPDVAVDNTDDRALVRRDL